MSWIALALISAALSGVVQIFNKVIVDRIVQDIRTGYLVFGVLSFSVGLVVVALNPIQGEFELFALGAAVAAGVFESCAVMLLLHCLRSEEVSRVVSVTQTSPVFVAVAAFLFIGEHLGPWQWMAILLTVCGAILVSTRIEPKEHLIRVTTFSKLVLISIFFGSAQIFSEIALRSISQWNMFGLFLMVVAVGFFLVSFRRSTTKEAMEIMRSASRFGWFVAVCAVGMVALFLRIAAIDFGPVSLVSPIIATRPLFVFIYVVLSTWLFPSFVSEPFTKKTTIIKLIGISMIVTGVSAIAAE